MKLLKLTLPVIAFFCFTLFSCNNDQMKDELLQQNVQQSVDKAKIDALVEKLSQEGDDQSFEALYNEYTSLTVSEMNYYIESKKRFVLNSIEKQYNNPSSEITNGRISKEDFESFRTSINEATKMSMEINSLSIEKYGKPFNKITGEEMDQLFPSLKREYSLAPLSSSVNKSNEKVLACDWGNYYSRATTGTANRGVSKSTYYKNQVKICSSCQRQDDCDYILAYRGTYSRMSAWTGDDYIVLRLLGNQTAMRQTGYTDIVIGDKIFTYLLPSRATLRMY